MLPAPHGPGAPARHHQPALCIQRCTKRVAGTEDDLRLFAWDPLPDLAWGRARPGIGEQETPFRSIPDGSIDEVPKPGQDLLQAGLGRDDALPARRSLVSIEHY